MTVFAGCCSERLGANTLQIHDVAHARPEITKTVDTMVKKGKWGVPGYRVS